MLLATIVAVPLTIIIILVLFYSLCGCMVNNHKWEKIISTIKEGEKCPKCKGRGSIYHQQGTIVNGLGEIVRSNGYDLPCEHCGESGWIKRPITNLLGHSCVKCRIYRKYE